MLWQSHREHSDKELVKETEEWLVRQKERQQTCVAEAKRDKCFKKRLITEGAERSSKMTKCLQRSDDIEILGDLGENIFRGVVGIKQQNRANCRINRR